MSVAFLVGALIRCGKSRFGDCRRRGVLAVSRVCRGAGAGTIFPWGRPTVGAARSRDLRGQVIPLVFRVFDLPLVRGRCSCR
jgi:hypothetical protein